MKVAVIGGGASGLIAAISASVKNDVVIIDANSECGKKLLATGNGRCNYWNSDINISHYNTDNYDALFKIISKTNQELTLNLLNKIGVYPRIKNGYYYPYSNQASGVLNLLMLEVKKKNIRIINDLRINDIKKINDKFILNNDNNLEFDNIIIACGSCACPKSGSDGSGYDLASNFGHTINKVLPSLVQLRGNEKFFKEWNGIRTDVNIKICVDNEVIKTENGEIQLTDYGISGICVFNLSSIASKNLYLGKNVSVKINFVPFLNGNFDKFINDRNNTLKNRTISELLEGILNHKLIFVLLSRAGIDRNIRYDDMNINDRNKLCKVIEEFEMDIVDTNSFDKAQVATGGISLNEINPYTMESKLIDGLYFVGEVLDVDGECGGFNLAFAFITGFIAGGSIC